MPSTVQSWNYDTTPPTPIALPANDPTPAIPINLNGGPAALNVNMQSKFQPAFINLSGGGPTLKSLTACAADVGSHLLGEITNGDGSVSRGEYRVVAGTDAEALPDIVHPANFDAVNNAVIFMRLGV